MLSFSASSFSRWDYLIALLSGLSLVFAFAPFGFYPITWLATAVLFWLNLKVMTRWQRVRLAWVFGIGLFAGGAHWIFYSIYFFGGANGFVAVLMTSLFVLGIALTLMLFGWLLSWFATQSHLLKLLVIFPAAWGLTEWFRSWFLTGFPWLQLGHAQSENWFAHYAPIIGSLGISWVVALGAGAVVLLALGTQRERLIAVSLLLVSMALGFGLGWIQWTKPVGDKLYVSMIQANIKQEEKWDQSLNVTHVQKHLDMMERHMENSHVIIWPETAIADTFQQSMNDLILPLQQNFATQENDLLVGGFEYDKDTGAMYNAIMRIGKELDVYGKRHLVPFSEYIPFLKYLRFLEKIVILPYDNVTPWKGKVNLMVAGQPMRMSVCYEDAYGEEMRDGLPEATMLVNVSNDGWFTGSIEAQQHAQIARFRAMETGRYLLRSTNNGVTEIIDPRGKNVADHVYDAEGKPLQGSTQYKEAVIAGWAQPMQGSTPYIFWGNGFIVILLSLMLGVSAWLGRGTVRETFI